MACGYPVGTYRKDGSLTFRPCSQCISCRLAMSRDWAVRAVHEAQMHDQNTYLTLTYNEENLPKDKSIHKKTLQNFMKRYRENIYPQKIRFLGCGEYGETCKICGKSKILCQKQGCNHFKAQTGRPHYHLCIFGHQFRDQEILKHDSKKNITYYKSDTLEKDIWKKGFCTIGELNFHTAAYVARYVTKKILGSSKQAEKLREERYGKLEPEFALMSRMPGLGNHWVKKYYTDIYPKDFVTINGIKHPPPKYYDSVYQKLKPEQFREIKQKRRERESITTDGLEVAPYHNHFKEQIMKNHTRSL